MTPTLTKNPYSVPQIPKDQNDPFISQDRNPLPNYLQKYCEAQQLTQRSIQQTNAKLCLEDPHSLLWIVDVLEDGWGDLRNCLSAIQLTKQEYPKWTMRVLIFISQDSIPFPIEELSEEEYLVIGSKPKPDMPLWDEMILFSATSSPDWASQLKHQIPPLRLKVPLIAKKIDEFVDFLKTADLQIQVSTDLRVYHQNIDKKSPKFLSFVEYGLKKYDTIPACFCMGLGPHSCGIYIMHLDEPKQCTNALLTKYYTTKEKVYFSYGSTNESGIIKYVSLVNALNPDAKELNIMTNFVDTNKIRVMAYMLAEQRIQTVLVDKNEQEKTMCTLKNPSKVLRLINPFPLSNDDMIYGMKKSAEPVGVAGNGSFSEVMALDQLPFYHMRLHSVLFAKELLALAKSATPDSEELIRYLTYMADHESFTPIPIELTALKSQWAELTVIIRRDWDVKNAYLSEINSRIRAQQESYIEKIER